MRFRRQKMSKRRPDCQFFVNQNPVVIPLTVRVSEKFPGIHGDSRCPSERTVNVIDSDVAASTAILNFLNAMLFAVAS